METIGVRELKNQTSEIVRVVREQMVEYVITVHGEPVALLRPITEEDTNRFKLTEIEVALAEMELLANEVSAAWQSSKTGVELVAEQRRY